MSINLVALSASSGLPLFTRRASLNRDQSVRCDEELSTGIDLNTVTTLYSLNLFSRLNDCDVKLAKSDRSTIKWTLRGNLVLIAIANDIDYLSQNHLDILLVLTFDAIVMMCGLKDTTDLNVERLKRNVKLSYTQIDYFLSGLASSRLGRLELASQSIDYALTVRSSYLTSLVNSAAQSASTNYCAIFAHRKLLAASKDWWSRLNTTKDSFLICTLINSLLDSESFQGNCLSREVFIYLPCISPTSLSRLVVSQITEGVLVCLLCGEYPPLDYIQNDIIAPLSDLKLQQEKLSRYICEVKHTKLISQATLSELFGKHCSLLSDIAAFILFHRELKLHIVFNEDLVEQYLDEIIAFCGLDQADRSGESYVMGAQVGMCRVNNQSTLVCVLFECPQSPKQMHVLANTLLDSLLKAKHFWP